MEAKWIYPADLICEVMERIYDRELTTLTGGNISMMEGETMWVTPTSIDKKILRREDIIRVHPDGAWTGAHKPTSEYRIHHRILTRHPNIKAVLHAHSPALVTISTLHEVPDTKLTLGSWELLGQVGLTEYAMPGTMKLVECVGETFDQGYQAAILKNHAAFLGSEFDLWDGFRRFEQLDYASELSLLAWGSDSARSLTRGQIDAFCGSVKTYPEEEAKGFAPDDLEARRQLKFFAKRAYDRKMFTSGFGSISVRIEGGFVINPEGGDNGRLDLSDFVTVNGGHCERGKRPDKMAQLHEEIYLAHPEINSVILAAPVNATLFAVTDLQYNVYLLPESYGVLRSAEKVPFDELAADRAAIANYIDGEHPFGLLENIGILLAGPNLPMAFDKLEVAEFTAKSIRQADACGKPIRNLTREQCEECDAQEAAPV